jgi:DNA mismatch repair protein MutL
VAVLDIRLPPGEVDVNIHPAKSEIKFRSDADVFRTVQRAVRRTLVAQMPVPRVEEVLAPYQATPHDIQKLWERSEAAPTAPSPGTLLMDSLPVLRVVG